VRVWFPRFQPRDVTLPPTMVAAGAVESEIDTMLPRITILPRSGLTPASVVLVQLLA
jgi:hypothetical protein